MGLEGMWERKTVPSPAGEQIGEKENALGTRRDRRGRNERCLGNNGNILLLGFSGWSRGRFDTAFKSPKRVILND